MELERLYSKISNIIEQGNHGNNLRESELAQGYRMANPAIDLWYNTEDWNQEFNIVSTKGKYVRIVALLAKKESSGAFSRLIDNIIKAQLIPIVVAPLGLMIAILNNWGWKMQLIGSDFDSRVDLWRPTKEWINRRKQLDNHQEI
jgi:hypothetical protein